MVAQLAAIPIATTIGEFAAPYLIKEAGKIGVKKFIQTYGSTAWQSIAGVTGGMIAQLTEPVDLQKEKLFGMPISRITGQSPVYSDIDEDKEKQIPTKVTEEEPTTPTEPEPPEGPDVVSELAETTALKEIQKKLEEQKGDITKQTEELVPDITTDISKEKVEKYFKDLDILYDKEWYGSVKNIQYAIDHGLEISEDDSLVYEKYGQKNPVHEYFEDEWSGGVAEGNPYAAEVMNAAFGTSLGGIDTPSYYQEYLEKLHEYTLNTLGKEFKAYRLASKAEMEELITSQKENYKSFSLNKNQALAFQHLVGKHYREEGGVGETRKDLVLIEAVIPYDSLVMRGRSDEKEIVVSGIGINGKEFNFYDLKGNLIQGATEGPLVKSDVSQQTKNLTSKIKNKITTWEKYMSRDEAEKAVKEGNITLKDLEIPAIKKQITFRKTGDGFDILFNKKVVGELNDITQLKQEDNTQKGNTRSYHISIINEDGSKGEPYDTFDGEKTAKNFAKEDVANALLRETEDLNYPSLRDIFQNLEYNKKGEPKALMEKLEKISKEIEDSRSKKN